MRRMLYAFLTGIFIVAATGCNLLDNGEQAVLCPRINPEGADLYSGNVAGIQNGAPWPADDWDQWLYAVTDIERNSLDLLIDISKSGHTYQEHLYFAGIPQKVGTYSLPQIDARNKEQASFFFTVIGGDVLGDVYDLDRSASSNFIAIEALDLSDCSVQGSFAFTAVREQTGRPAVTHPDTMRFTQGSFRTHVVRWVR